MLMVVSGFDSRPGCHKETYVIMMTLDEAIQHAKEVSAQCTNQECSLEHMQLAKWLEELKQRRLKDEMAIKMKLAAIQAGLC